MNPYRGILPRIVSWILFLFIAMGFILPEVRVFLEATDSIPVREQQCAWAAAQKYVYTTGAEKAFIRNWTIRQSSYRPLLYEVYPVTFFALPWRKVTARCAYDSQNDRLYPIGAETF